jgi:hypothetical protein
MNEEEMRYRVTAVVTSTMRVVVPTASWSGKYGEATKQIAKPLAIWKGRTGDRIRKFPTIYGVRIV